MDDGDTSKDPTIGDLTGVGKVVNSDVAKRTYDDALSPAMREFGELSRDSLKAFRLFTAPIQLIAAYQDRFASFCERVRSNVPDRHQREAAADVARPVMEALASTGDDSPLMSMFEELMARAIDDRHADKLSPTFAPLIRTLSPLEAKLVSALASGDQHIDVLYEIERKLILNRLQTDFSAADFGGGDHHLTLIQNLSEKRLVASLQKKLNKDEKYPNMEIQPGQRLIRFTYRLTMFGKWFTDSCVPSGSSPSKPR